jgi:hypothetical protein
MTITNKFTESVIEESFKARDKAYSGWDPDMYVSVWKMAFSAFDEANPDRNAFNALYDTLKGHWQVFRNLRDGKALDADAVYELLSRLPHRARRLRLSEITADHDGLLREVTDKAKSIKTGKNGASLVAMSKFLHFWNPRLFLIVDRWAMADGVLRRLWIRRSLPGDFDADASHYFDLLRWASGILRDNPAILMGFHRHIERVLDVKALPPDWDTYEATAIEWFLEGVVELPPAGVSQVESG